MSTAMMAITTNSSISVKPERRDERDMGSSFANHGDQAISEAPPHDLFSFAFVFLAKLLLGNEE
jgi:hypothetical protein